MPTARGNGGKGILTQPKKCNISSIPTSFSKKKNLHASGTAGNCGVQKGKPQIPRRGVPPHGKRGLWTPRKPPCRAKRGATKILKSKRTKQGKEAGGGGCQGPTRGQRKNVWRRKTFARKKKEEKKMDTPTKKPKKILGSQKKKNTKKNRFEVTRQQKRRATRSRPKKGNWVIKDGNDVQKNWEEKGNRSSVGGVCRRPKFRKFRQLGGGGVPKFDSGLRPSSEGTLQSLEKLGGKNFKLHGSR